MTMLFFLPFLPVWSAVHRTWASPLPYLSAHCAGTLPGLRSLRVGSLFGTVEGQGGKSRLPHKRQKLLRTFSAVSLPTASPFPQQCLQWVRPGKTALWMFGLFTPLTRAPSGRWTGSSKVLQPQVCIFSPHQTPEPRTVLCTSSTELRFVSSGHRHVKMTFLSTMPTPWASS